MKESLFSDLLSFFSELDKNNNKVWFNERKDHYKQLEKEFKTFCEEIALHIYDIDPYISKHFDPTESLFKVFRIYRDTRFSKNKIPLKTNISAYFSLGSKDATINPGYYFSVGMNDQSFIGGGLHMPPKDILDRIRTTIDKDPAYFQTVEEDPEFKILFPDGLSDYNSLKTIPRGYPKDHIAAPYLRLKSFFVGNNISDKAVTDPNFKQAIKDSFTQAEKLNQILRPFI